MQQKFFDELATFSEGQFCQKLFGRVYASDQKSKLLFNASQIAAVCGHFNLHNARNSMYYYIAVNDVLDRFATYQMPIYVIGDFSVWYD